MARLIDADKLLEHRFHLSPLHADNDEKYYYQLGWNGAIETICECEPSVSANTAMQYYYEERDREYCERMEDVWKNM